MAGCGASGDTRPAGRGCPRELIAGVGVGLRGGLAGGRGWRGAVRRGTPALRDADVPVS
jgi:hypothetical protein